jgi:Fe(3+) dicitrate transport protein
MPFRHQSLSFRLSRQIVLVLLAEGVLAFLAIKGSAQTQTTAAEQVIVTGEAIPSPTPSEDWKAKLDHIMPEMSGTEITVTKKATVIKLDQQPVVVNNNEQELFTKAPGLLITEQHTPGQFNFSYRGLGNPQESEFVTVLMDGVPLASDWIGFPTLYFLPLPQSVSEIQLIRSGSSLLYGPEPAPAVNFVTRHPVPGSPWSFYTEQIGGSDGLYSTYNVGFSSTAVSSRRHAAPRTLVLPSNFSESICSYDLHWETAADPLYIKAFAILADCRRLEDA